MNAWPQHTNAAKTQIALTQTEHTHVHAIKATGEVDLNAKVGSVGTPIVTSNGSQGCVAGIMERGRTHKFHM